VQPLRRVVSLLGVRTTLESSESLEDTALARALHAAATRSLEEHGVAFIDDVDLAAAPRSMRRSRTLVGSLKGSGDMWNWEVAPKPAMLLKSLADAAASKGHVIVYSSLEDAHLAFMQAPLTVTLGNPTEQDYAGTLKAYPSVSMADVNVQALYALHSQLAPADVASAVGRSIADLSVCASGKAVEDVKVDTEALLASVRRDLVSTSAVAPEDVEAVDLATYPGLEGIKEELEKQVLFPMEQPELARDLGLSPKRGVLIHGNPGTGKTTVGRWLAHRLKGKFFLVREMMVQSDIFKVFAAAKAAAPSVVFIDDADIIVGGWRPIDGGRGSDIFRFLLGHLDGITSRGENRGDVVVMLTGQDVKWMAEMLLRSGRIELWLKTNLPNPSQKREILKKYVREDPSALKLLGKNGGVPDVRGAAQCSDRFCCADLRRIVGDAKILAAWDRKKLKQEGKEADFKPGSIYLEEAAEAVRDMKSEVEQSMRKMYV
jgi:SpoVK/Ycf46/Vps4 family AAA+-type ATPase